jgi:hypothetical protein
MVEWAEEQDALADTKKHWYQGSWARRNIDAAVQNRDDPYCNTAMCIAGKVAFDAGWKLVFEADSTEVMDDGVTYEFAFNATKDGEIKSISTVGQIELGLTDGEADRLFDGNNSAEDIRYVAEAITNELL